MVKKRESRYARMTASELAAETRRRGLSKPEGMLNISEWADFLEADDAKATEVVEAPAESESADKSSKSSKKSKSEES